MVKVRAVIDIGTNSVKLTIAQVHAQGIRILQDTSQISRLGRDLATSGRIGEQSLIWNVELLKRLKTICDEHRVEEILCVGARTLRAASNATELKDRVFSETGIQINTLSERQEAQLTWLAAKELAAEHLGKVLVFDTGGGSTEFTLSEGESVIMQKSLPLGAVVLTDRFIQHDPISEAELKALQDYIQHSLAAAFPEPDRVFAIGSGGTPTTMAAVALGLQRYDAAKVHGFHLARGQISSQARDYRNLNLEHRKQLPGLPEGRADIILAGALIVQNVIKIFDLGGIEVSAKGLRHALIKGYPLKS